MVWYLRFIYCDLEGVTMMQAEIKKVLIDGYYEFHVFQGCEMIKSCQTLYQANQTLKGLL